MIDSPDLMQSNFQQESRLLQTRPLDISPIRSRNILLVNILRSRNMRRRIVPRQKPAKARGKRRAGCLADENRGRRRIALMEPSSIADKRILHTRVALIGHVCWSGWTDFGLWLALGAADRRNWMFF